jgi:hypothetical protein
VFAGSWRTGRVWGPKEENSNMFPTVRFETFHPAPYPTDSTRDVVIVSTAGSYRPTRLACCAVPVCLSVREVGGPFCSAIVCGAHRGSYKSVSSTHTHTQTCSSHSNPTKTLPFPIVPQGNKLTKRKHASTLIVYPSHNNNNSRMLAAVHVVDRVGRRGRLDHSHNPTAGLEYRMSCARLGSFPIGLYDLRLAPGYNAILVSYLLSILQGCLADYQALRCRRPGRTGIRRDGRQWRPVRVCDSRLGRLGPDQGVQGLAETDAESWWSVRILCRTGRPLLF